MFNCLLNHNFQGYVNFWRTGNLDWDFFMNVFSLVGSMIKPHTIFLHSALVASRNIRSNPKPQYVVKKAYRYFKIDSALAFLVALIINTLIVAIFAAGKIF